jgi:hypothetical protein
VAAPRATCVVTHCEGPHPPPTPPHTQPQDLPERVDGGQLAAGIEAAYGAAPLLQCDG